MDAEMEKALAALAKRLDESGLLGKMMAIYPLIGGARATRSFDLKSTMLVRSIMRKRSISKMGING